MAEASTSVAIPALGVARSGAVSRFTRWLASERVFRLIPFVLVETLFVLIVLVPFALTIWISLLKWRANRPFETARFSGLENYESVLGNDQFDRHVVNPAGIVALMTVSAEAAHSISPASPSPSSCSSASFWRCWCRVARARVSSTRPSSWCR